MGRKIATKVAFEGIDGAGKTYLLSKLLDLFAEQGLSAFYVDEIPESPVASLLREMLAHDPFFRTNHPFPTSTYATLLLAAHNAFRNEHTYHRYGEGYDYLLFDRDFATLYCYQKLLVSNDFEAQAPSFMDAVDLCARVGAFPEVKMVFVDTPLDLCVERIAARENARPGEAEIQFLFRAREEYVAYFADLSKTCDVLYLDGSATPSENYNILRGFLAQ